MTPTCHSRWQVSLEIYPEVPSSLDSLRFWESSCCVPKRRTLYISSDNTGQLVGSARKVACCQVWWTDLDPQDPNDDLHIHAYLPANNQSINQSINVTKNSDPARCSHIWLGASYSSVRHLRGFCFQDVRAKASCCCLYNLGFSRSVFLIFTKMLKCITGCWDFLDPAREGAFSILRAWKYDCISHTWEIIQNRLHKSDWANLDFEHLLWFLAFHLFISQYLGRLKSFHLAWRGCALKWMERGRLDGVCGFFFFCHQSDHTFFINRKKKSSYWKQWRKHERTKYCVTDSWSPWELAGVTQDLLAQICQAQRPELADPRSWHHFIRIVTSARSRSHCHGFLLISCKPGRSPSEIYDEFFFFVRDLFWFCCCYT